MTSKPIVTRLWRPWQSTLCLPQLDLHTLALHRHRLPRWVQGSSLVAYYLDLLGPLDWRHFPERDLLTQRGMPPVPFAPFVAACLVKLDQQLPYFTRLCHYLVDHPALAWTLGFADHARRPLASADIAALLPTQRHFPRLLRKVPNSALQYLLTDTVRLLRDELADMVPDFGCTISLDVKHILAWVRQNNPRDYVADRFDKTKQPQGDPDCRLGCKRKRNQRIGRERRASSDNPPPTPTDNPIPAATIAVSEFYWGYASGIVVTKVPDSAEIVLAELTLPFDQSDIVYFEPLMAATEQRLGFRPRFGALDAAFDAWYIYEYFHREGHPWQDGFAAVPYSERGGKRRRFTPQGLPLCDADLAMPIKHTFFCKTTRVPHERARYACPLLYPEQTAAACPVDHKRWNKGGCLTTLATPVGARLRHQIDRDTPLYKEIYNQRTATERVNSLAKELGIERPKLRNQQAITNQNTLIYVLLNLRALQRIRQRKAAQ